MSPQSSSVHFYLNLSNHFFNLKKNYTPETPDPTRIAIFGITLAALTEGLLKCVPIKPENLSSGTPAIIDTWNLFLSLGSLVSFKAA